MSAKTTQVTEGYEEHGRHSEALSSLISESYAEVSKLKKFYEERIILQSLKILQDAFPKRKFDPEYLSTGRDVKIGGYGCPNKHFEAARYQDNNLERYRVTGSGICERRETELGEAIRTYKPLFQAVSQHDVVLVLSKKDRQCELSAYWKNSGEHNRNLGWSPKRLTHTDSYGFEYIVLDEEKCYLEPVKGVVK